MNEYGEAERITVYGIPTIRLTDGHDLTDFNILIKICLTREPEGECTSPDPAKFNA